MSFPFHDRPWLETAGVLLAHLPEEARVLAPDQFWWVLPVPVHRWVTSNLADDQDYDFVVVHKGQLDWVPRRALERLMSDLDPIFANEVFVILASADAVGSSMTPVDPDSSHFKALVETVAGLSESPLVPNPNEANEAIRDTAVLYRFADLSDTELRATQDQFFDDGGYVYPTPRDKAYHAAMTEHLESALARWPGRMVLDVACGALEFPEAPDVKGIVRFDLSSHGVAMARDVYGGAADGGTVAGHGCADAEALPVADGSVDAVVIMDSIEHIRHADRAIAEAHRVLRPDGEFLVSFANTDSVNQIVARALGYPTFATNHQHIREFNAAEMRAILDAAGFDVVQSAGLDLLPYWGVPGIDDAVREVTDNDPTVIETMLTIGAAVGERHAYTGVLLARKR